MTSVTRDVALAQVGNSLHKRHQSMHTRLAATTCTGLPSALLWDVNLIKNISSCWKRWIEPHTSSVWNKMDKYSTVWKMHRLALKQQPIKVYYRDMALVCMTTVHSSDRQLCEMPSQLRSSSLASRCTWRVRRHDEQMTMQRRLQQLALLHTVQLK